MRLAVILSLALVACATGPARDYDIGAMQRQLDDRGIGFGVTRIPGEDGVLFQVRVRTSDAASPEALAQPEPDIYAAAVAAAPEGCRIGAVTRRPDGAARVSYICDR